jgi:hypothetical protein
MNSPATDVQVYLASAGLVDGSTGWASSVGYLPSQPNQMVVIDDLGGLAGEATVAYERLRFQVIVRGERFDYAVAYNKVMAIYDTLNTTAISATYPLLIADQPPLSTGLDDLERACWSVNFEIHRTR